MADEGGIRAYDIRKGDLAFERPSQHFDPPKPGDLYDLLSKLKTDLMMGHAPNVASMPMGPPSLMPPPQHALEITKQIINAVMNPVNLQKPAP